MMKTEVRDPTIEKVVFEVFERKPDAPRYATRDKTRTRSVAPADVLDFLASINAADVESVKLEDRDGARRSAMLIFEPIEAPYDQRPPVVGITGIYGHVHGLAIAFVKDEPALDMVLPCDVMVPPATILRRGMKARTLLAAIERRTTTPNDDEHRGFVRRESFIKEHRNVLRFVSPGLVVLRNMLASAGLTGGVEKADEMIAEVSRLIDPATRVEAAFAAEADEGGARS